MPCGALQHSPQVGCYGPFGRGPPTGVGKYLESCASSHYTWLTHGLVCLTGSCQGKGSGAMMSQPAWLLLWILKELIGSGWLASSRTVCLTGSGCVYARFPDSLFSLWLLDAGGLFFLSCLLTDHSIGAEWVTALAVCKIWASCRFYKTEVCYHKDQKSLVLWTDCT